MKSNAVVLQYVPCFVRAAFDSRAAMYLNLVSFAVYTLMGWANTSVWIIVTAICGECIEWDLRKANQFMTIICPGITGAVLVIIATWAREHFFAQWVACEEVRKEAKANAASIMPVMTINNLLQANKEAMLKEPPATVMSMQCATKKDDQVINWNRKSCCYDKELPPAKLFDAD